jgi:hypothetical protein
MRLRVDPARPLRRVDFRAVVFRDAAFRRAAPALFRAPDFAVFLRAALPLGVRAPAVLRFPPPLRAIDRAPAPAFRFEGVIFCPLVFELFFLAIHASPRSRPIAAAMPARADPIAV